MPIFQPISAPGARLTPGGGVVDAFANISRLGDAFSRRRERKSEANEKSRAALQTLIDLEQKNPEALSGLVGSLGLEGLARVYGLNEDDAAVLRDAFAPQPRQQPAQQPQQQPGQVAGAPSVPTGQAAPTAPAAPSPRLFPETPGQARGRETQEVGLEQARADVTATKGKETRAAAAFEPEQARLAAEEARKVEENLITTAAGKLELFGAIDKKFVGANGKKLTTDQTNRMAATGKVPADVRTTTEFDALVQSITPLLDGDTEAATRLATSASMIDGVPMSLASVKAKILNTMAQTDYYGRLPAKAGKTGAGGQELTPADLKRVADLAKSGAGLRKEVADQFLTGGGKPSKFKFDARSVVKPSALSKWTFGLLGTGGDISDEIDGTPEMQHLMTRGSPDQASVIADLQNFIAQVTGDPEAQVDLGSLQLKLPPKEGKQPLKFKGNELVQFIMRARSNSAAADTAFKQAWLLQPNSIPFADRVDMALRGVFDPAEVERVDPQLAGFLRSGGAGPGAGEGAGGAGLGADTPALPEFDESDAGDDTPSPLVLEAGAALTKRLADLDALIPDFERRLQEALDEPKEE